MKTITRHFETLKQAERYQNRLYGRFNGVYLVRAPRFTEAGTYSWEVNS